jgi:predicted nuclease of predicted toxin-antitoxin system
MKILLDECVTKRLKKYLKEFDVFTVRELRLSGVKNGTLMSYCVENKFDILLSIDKNLLHQQNIEKFALSIIIFNCVSSKIEELSAFIPSFKSNIENFKKNQAYLIEK